MAASDTLNQLEHLSESSPNVDQLTALIRSLDTTLEPADLTTALDHLGTLARTEPSRAPLAHAGALDHALTTLTEHTQPSDSELRRLSYRIIANVCADTAESREILSPQFKLLAKHFENDVLHRADGGWAPEASAACAAVLNYARDNDDSAEQFAEIENVLLALLEKAHVIMSEVGKDADEYVPGFFWDLLLEYLETVDLSTAKIDAVRLACALFDAFDDAETLPDDDSGSWVPVMARMFNEEEVRLAFAKDELRFIQLLKLFYRIQLHYAGSKGDGTRCIYLKTATVDLSGFEPICGPHIKDRTNKDLWVAISMIVELDDFPSTYSSLDGAIPWQLLQWIAWPTEETRSVNEYLMQLAMLIVGNLSKLEKYPQFLEQSHMETRLYDIVSRAKDDQTRALALDLLKHCFLNRASEAKEDAILKARPGMVEALNSVEGQFWMTAHASLSAARVMLTAANVRNLLEPIEEQSGLGTEPTASYWKRALLVSRESNIHPLKLAVGRLVAAVLRSMSSVDTTDNASDVDKRDMTRFFLQDLDPSEPLGAMLLAGKDDEQKEMVHSEGWFAMALLAKSRRGAELVSQRLANEEIHKKLTDLLGTEKEQQNMSPQKAHQRQNVVIMLKGLQKMGLNIRGATQRPTIEELLSQLTTEDVVAQAAPADITGNPPA